MSTAARLLSFLGDRGVNRKFQILKPKEVIPVEELDGDSSKLVIFDDIKIDSSHMEPIKEYCLGIATAIASTSPRATTIPQNVC